MARTLWRDRVRRVRLGLRALLRPGQVERELDEELRFHLEQDGRERGRLEGTKESYRQAGDLYALQTLARDLRYGARLLRRSPTFTLVAVATLGLGIGLNVALFTVVRTVLLRPLPYAAADRLVALASVSARDRDGQNVGWLTAEDWQQRARSFTSIATYFQWGPTLSGSGTGGSQPAVLRGEHVSANFFPTLGVKPLLGRNFTPEEDRPHRDRVVILSYAFWRSRFGGAPGVVGRTLQFNREPYTVIGVLPGSFDAEPFRLSAQVWTPIGYDASIQDACRSCQHLEAIGRLAPGVSLAAAGEEMNAIARQLAASYPNDYPPDAVVLITPLRARMVGAVRGLLWLLLGATGLVLLMVCANLAGLQLARGAQRRREMAMRAALGAGRLRLLRQLLTEGALLGMLGGAVGSALAFSAIGLLRSWAAAALPRMQELHMTPLVLGFAAGVSLAAGMLVGVAPALKASRTGAAEVLHGGRGIIRDVGPQRLLVAAEVALAVVLAVGAGLVLKSFVRVLEVSPGFDPHRAYTADFELSGPAYSSDAAQNQFAQQLLERLAAAPGIQAAGIVSVLPLDPGNYDTRGYFTLDPPVTTAVAMTRANAYYDTYFVSPGYFAAIGIRLRRGRLFTAGDMAHPTAAAVVGASFAQKLWPGQDPLGKAIRLGGSRAYAKDDWSRVVGVVDDVHQYSLDQTATPEVYVPYPLNAGDAASIVVRSSLAPASMQQAIEHAVWGLDAEVPVTSLRALTALVAQSLAQRRLTLELIGGFGVLALLLAALGIYGVVAYTTAHRTSEIGTRMALGAGGGEILRLVVGSGMRPALLGMLLGAVGALVAGRLLSGVIYQISPGDPATFTAVLAMLIAVALAASALPAWRASRLDPAQAIRHE